MRSMALGLVFALAADCAGPLDQTDLANSIVLVVQVDESRFTPGARLDARVWNQAQLGDLENNARCNSTRDPHGGTQIQCPPGVQYREVTPERFEIDLANPVELQTQHLRSGERFRLTVSGLSRDGCNTTSATITSTARSPRTLVDSLVWLTTTKACPKGGAE